MRRTADQYIHATRIGGESKRVPSAHYTQDPKTMPLSRLKNHLCTSGPQMCEKCGICEFGNEYVRRVIENRKKEANTVFFQITCSNCGRRSAQLPYNGSTTPEKIIRAGWNSYGSACYCPKCVKTWDERNGTDHPLQGAVHTRDTLQQKMIDELNRIIRQRSTGDWE